MLKMMKKMDDLLRNCRSFVGVALMWKAYKEQWKQNAIGVKMIKFIII